jgi:nucleotide-binding universal stress UspA family protein
MSIIGASTTVQIESIIFATDFSPASQNAGLYASALSIHFGIDLLVAHAFTLFQASLEVEAEHPLASQQRKELTHDLTLTAESLQAGRGLTQSALVLHAGSLKIHRILYATDCSAEAAHGAPVAVALAEAFAAKIDVLNVVSSKRVDHPDQLYKLQEHFYNALDLVVPQSAKKLCEPRNFVSVGDPQSEILKHIDDREIDLLVMGLRRNTHLGTQNRTSGAFPIIVEASCPVITVASGSVYRP